MAVLSEAVVERFADLCHLAHRSWTTWRILYEGVRLDGDFSKGMPRPAAIAFDLVMRACDCSSRPWPLARNSSTICAEHPSTQEAHCLEHVARSSRVARLPAQSERSDIPCGGLRVLEESEFLIVWERATSFSRSRLFDRVYNLLSANVSCTESPGYLLENGDRDKHWVSIKQGAVADCSGC